MIKDATKNVVKIYTKENDDFIGVLLHSDSKFVSILTIKDWHFDGITIFPRKNVAKIRKYENYSAEMQIIVWKNGANVNKYSWINYTSYLDLFSSLEENYERAIYIDLGLRAEVGVLRSCFDSHCTIETISASGSVEGEIKVNYSRIMQILFDDEYSSVLFDFSKSSAKTNN